MKKIVLALMIITIASCGGNNTNPAAQNETPATSTLKVYPNPVTNSLTIDLQQFENKKVLLKVTNLSGQAVSEKTVFSTKSYALDVTALPAGSYILQVISGVESENIKFVKQ